MIRFKTERYGYRIPRLALAGVWLSGLILGPPDLKADPPASDPKQAAVTPDELREHLKYIAGDELKGRGLGSEGGRKAAAYITSHLQALSLKPAAPKDSFLQSFSLPSLTGFGTRNALALEWPGNIQSFIFDRDFHPFTFSGTANITGTVVFAGYGIAAPECQYDDYANLDVKGKVVLIFRHEPQENDPNSKFNGTDITSHSFLTEKARLAADRGASALLIVDDPLHTLEPEAFDKRIEQGAASFPIPVIHVKRAVVEPLFEHAGSSMKEVHRLIDQSLQAAPRFELPEVTATIETDLQFGDLIAANVAAILEGSDPVLRKEYVVIGAHRDHLGTGEGGGTPDHHTVGRIHYGADDNGSGTVTLMEIAEAFALAKDRPRRSLLFLWFDGEESGLLGSAYYTKHPVIPLEHTVAMINMDMVGRADRHQVNFTGLGTSPSFEAFGEKFPAKYPDLTFLVNPLPNPLASDHANFFRRNIPVLMLWTMIHKDYHRPTDTWDKINYDDMAKIGTVCADLARDIANLDTRPVFTTPKSAYLGILPKNPSGSDLTLGQIMKGSPAEGAGLLPEDVIEQLNGKKLESFRELAMTLAAKKPGEKVKITVRRGSSSLNLEVTLAERPAQ